MAGVYSYSAIRREGEGAASELKRMHVLEHIVDPSAAAHLYGIDLKQIKVGGCLLNMLDREVSLIVLVGYQVLDWNEFKFSLRNKLHIFHVFSVFFIHVMTP